MSPSPLCDNAARVIAPRVGIVVPAFNAERYLERTLASVLGQRETRWTCVVVDDGSRDGSVEVARSFAKRDERFQVSVQPENAGVSRARSAGAAILPATEFLIFLDADDVWHADALERLLATLDDARHVDAPAAHATATFIGGDDEPLATPALAVRLRRLEWRDGAVVEPDAAEPTSSRMLATWPCVITPGAVLIRRSAWDASGGFDASLAIGEDWELWYRLSLRSPIAYLPEPLIDYRVHGTSASSSWTRSFKLAKARRRVFAAGDVQQRRYARRAYRGMCRRLGTERLGAGFAAIRRRNFAAAIRSLLAGTINLTLSLKP